MKIAYVILHYQNKEITIKAINCLLKQGSVHEVYIVVVDNASGNGSGKELLKLYSSNDNIIFLLNEINVGFAKGNNIGYQYAKNILNVDIIVAMNNDVYINDSDFSKKLAKIVNDNKNIALIGPDILSYKGEHQNPLEFDAKSNIQMIVWIIKVVALRILFSVPVLNKLICNQLNKREKNILQKKNDKMMKNKEYNFTKYNVMLHGACVIYTPTWTKKENMAFLPYTFMFAEEYLMYDYIQFKQYKTLYEPTLSVEHEDGATQQVQANNAVKKRKFFYKNEMYSLIQIFCHRIRGKYEYSN